MKTLCIPFRVLALLLAVFCASEAAASPGWDSSARVGETTTDRSASTPTMASSPISEPTLTFENIVDALLTPENVRALSGQNVVIVSANDVVTAEFETVFQNELVKRQIATVVFSDSRIIQPELDRQYSGLVSDKEMASIVHQRGASIVIQLILSRIPDSKRIRAIMTAVHVEHNTVEASGIVTATIPAHYNTALLPIQGVDERDKIRGIVNGIVGKAVSGIYNYVPQVHIVGKSLTLPDFNEDVAYWLNGQRVALPKSKLNEGNVNAIAVLGSDVYIAGTTPSYGDPQDAVYLLNGRLKTLPKTGTSAGAKAIAVSGSNVYIAGWDGDDAVYWLNDQRRVLPKTGKNATTYAIAVSGTDVHIVGDEMSDTAGEDIFVDDVAAYNAVYWLNGQRRVLPKTGKNATAYAIAVSGTDVHIVGREDSDAVYWLNGQRKVLPKTGRSARAVAIAISGSNVYIVGTETNNDGYDAVYWLNGQRRVLPRIDDYGGEPTAIAMSGTDFHIIGKIAGSSAPTLVYWINGQLTNLPVIGYDNATAIAITQ